ncbi:MAG: hypothetical protein GEV07_13935 [Streptosporangiales bacterium]|nr:hypothetical protein [Streptosporangiales bacterium]
MTSVSKTDSATAQEPPRSSGGTRSRRRGYGAVVLLLATAVAGSLPWWGVDTHVLSVGYTVAFYAAVAQSWNLMSGFTGYISFAHGALVGIGTYAGILAMNAGGNLLTAVLAGALAAVAASVLIGLPSLRLRGIAFAFATIFFQAAMLLVVQKAGPITGGSEGLAARAIVSLEDLFVTMVAIAGIASVLVYALRRARLGLRLLTIREDETAARTIDVKTVQLKLGAFATSALFAGAAGAVHGFFLATVFPQNVFHLRTSLEPLVLALIGGAASTVGPLVMAAVYGISQDALQSLGSELHLAMLGVILVVAVLFARNGLADLATRLWRRLRERGNRD